MFGFSNLLKSNFGDSATPMPSPLEPRLKNGQDAATAPPPVSFDTPVGKRRVPRLKDPERPRYEMIRDARNGVLSGFLRLGKLFRASDFVGIVNPKTAIITLNEIYDFETRCLPAMNDQPISPPLMGSMVPIKKTADTGADDEKTLRNLFYISLNQDELPSFHFWTKLGDLDPVTAGEQTDWGEVFAENPPSPATAAKIAVLEKERKDKGQHRANEQQNTQNRPPLEFLDQYNDINLPGLDREPTQGQPAGAIDPIPQVSASENLEQSPIRAEVLLQFNRGGMYLRELTHKALYAMACWLVKNEEEEAEEDEDEEDEAKKGSKISRDMFLDILEPGNRLSEEKIVSVSRVSNRKFQENIKPFLCKPDNQFRIRSTRYQSSWNSESGFDSGGAGEKYDLKLVRPNIGYCYCSASWHIPRTFDWNSLRFEKALAFLFDWELSAYPSSKRLSLDIPGHGSFDLNRDSDVVVDATIQRIFAELSKGSVNPDARPVEIFIRDVVEDDTDGSDFLGGSPPRFRNPAYGQSPGDVPDVHPSISGAAQPVNQESITASNMTYQPPSDNIGSSITGQSSGYTLTKATEIRGGPDLPSIHPRLLSISETNKLQERLKIAEASVVETDDLQERLSSAKEKLSEMNGLEKRLRASEDRARLKSSCPFCLQDWAGVTRQQQQDHLKLHQKSIVQQPAAQKCPHPNCVAWLGENQRESTYEAIWEHLKSHIEEEHSAEGMCEHQYCYTNMYALTAEQEEEHESIHRDNAKIEEERNQLLEKVRDTEDAVTERDRLQQQVTHLQDAVNERDRLQEDLIHITEERDSLQNRVLELERRLRVASGPDEGLQPEELEPETEVDKNPKHPGQREAPKKLRYCNICLKSVDKMSAHAKTKHAENCETSVSEFLLFSPAEAKAERENRKNGRDAVKPQAQEGPKEGVVSKGEKGKQKASAKFASLERHQDELRDTDPVEQPKASKATSRKTLKRKNDTFQPSNEDESEDEEIELPRKKPKLKTKAAKIDKEIAPTRKSTRIKDIYQPPREEDDDEKEVDEADDEPSTSVKGGKRKKRAAAEETRVTKKAKTKK